MLTLEMDNTNLPYKSIKISKDSPLYPYAILNIERIESLGFDCKEQESEVNDALCYQL